MAIELKVTRATAIKVIIADLNNAPTRELMEKVNGLISDTGHWCSIIDNDDDVQLESLCKEL